MSSYYVMKGLAEERTVLLYSLESPSNRDNWMLARPFSVAISEPVEAVVNAENETGVLLPFYNTPQIMREDVYDAVRSAGVDNVDVYKALVKREDGSVFAENYLAYNILGALKAVDLGKSQFAPENPSRMMDASIEKLTVDESQVGNLLMFRLAESLRTIVVHESVKTAVEARGIAHIAFLASEQFIF
jgi:hypothetical protein